MYREDNGGGEGGPEPKRQDTSALLIWLIAIAVGLGMGVALCGCAAQPALKPMPALPKPVAIGPKDKGAAVCFDAANVARMGAMIQALQADDEYVRKAYAERR